MIWLCGNCQRFCGDGDSAVFREREEERRTGEGRGIMKNVRIVISNIFYFPLKWLISSSFAYGELPLSVCSCVAWGIYFLIRN